MSDLYSPATHTPGLVNVSRFGEQRMELPSRHESRLSGNQVRPQILQVFERFGVGDEIASFTKPHISNIRHMDPSIYAPNLLQCSEMLKDLGHGAGPELSDLSDFMQNEVLPLRALFNDYYVGLMSA